MSLLRLHKTVGVNVGDVQVGGGAPVVVQSMTMTDTADARATAEQCIALAGAGAASGGNKALIGKVLHLHRAVRRGEPHR